MKIRNIYKSYYNQNNDVEALKDISVNIPNKGMTFILGASGCGKTTLLNIISGKDNSYEGSVEYDGRVESITQEIELFEKLSIMDNLLLVSDDKRRIHELLKKFHLFEPNKIVKKLSVGEKKRVQIIRSFLSQANYLVCDEPTASLDHENGKIVMDLLKEVSKDTSVIVVTHQISLVDLYADYVFRMGKGCILDSYVINDVDRVIDIGVTNEKKALHKYNKILLKTMKSRWQENIFCTCLLFIGTFVLFVSLFIIPSLNSTVRATNNWLNGKNVIITQPNEGNNNNIYNTNADCYFFYDLYKKGDVYLVKNTIDGILGYRIGWDEYKYSSDSNSSYAPKITVDELRIIVEQYKAEYLETGIEPFYRYEFFLDKLRHIDSTYPNDSYPENYHLTDYIYDYRNYIGLRTKGVFEMDTIPFASSVYLRNQQSEIVPYQLFDDVELDLVCGNMPRQNNEIVLSKNMAEYFKYELKLSSLEDLIGEEIPLIIQRPIITGSTYDNFRRYPLIVSGITYMESQYENQVFFKDGAFESYMVDMFEYNPELATYHYIHFLVDPLADSELISNHINLLLESKESKFMAYNIMNVDTSENYQDPSILSIFVVFALLTLLVFYIIMQVLLNKRIVKENSILRRYNYNALGLQIQKMLLLISVAGIIQACFLPYLCTAINTFANNIGFSDIVSYDIFVYLKSLILMAMIVMLFEGGFYAIRTQKHS